MRPSLGVIVYLILFILTLRAEVLSENGNLKKDRWQLVGRGLVEWHDQSVSLEDAYIAMRDTARDSVCIRFTARTTPDEKEVQIWSGFGFSDRNNRYALGMRGGNHNDLYLCRYQEGGRNKMLALESLDFEPLTGRWYSFRIIVWDRFIRVYLDEEKQPRISITDSHPLPQGRPVLGGGWIKTEYKDVSITHLSENEIRHFESDTIKYTVKRSPQKNQALRRTQRAAYQPVVVKTINKARTVVSLQGNWLFKPEKELNEHNNPFSESLDDTDWHVMHVPDFWKPVRNWLHLQDSPLPHRGSGVSDNYREKELDRCESFTFDYESTDAAWYRHAVILPENIGNKRFKLHFDAVSKVADVYVNGQYAGGHVGMFGDFKLDITDLVKPGRNLIAVNVKVRKYKKTADADKNVARAVSVDINNDMLNSLPHGMFRGDEGGIWQPVRLIITQPVHIIGFYADVRTDGGDFDITVTNEGAGKQNLEAAITLTDKSDDSVLFTSGQRSKVLLKSGETVQITCKTGTVNPELWSPENPHLYRLDIQLYQDGNVTDRVSQDIGFRTFVVEGNRFYLNGKPYWLRGANHPPCGIAPNDSALANTFMNLMHEGNQMVTRSHGCPFTATWMRAADRQGVGVSYEGSWPWMMIDKKIPSPELLEIWKKETLSLVRKYRNHPSLLLWTMNNEMYFTMFTSGPEDIRLKKWTFLSEVIKEVRRLHPDMPISADSGYSRVLGDYKKNLEPHGIDDGDIDDRHIYFCWYNRDFFQIYNGEWDDRIYWSPGANPDRPFFSQENSTGYPNNDSGHFCRKYIFKHYVPQAWLGDWAYEDHDPQIGLQRHAFMTKELAEVIRRNGGDAAGTLLFANLCWYQNVYDADRIRPYPVHDAVKRAFSPVLVSAELFGRHFYAGTTMTPEVTLVNNAEDGTDLVSAELGWKIVYDTVTLASGKVDAPDVPFYGKRAVDLSITFPDELPVEKAACKLVLNLSKGGRPVSENEYDLLISAKDWVKPRMPVSDKTIALFDRTGQTARVLDFLNIEYNRLKDLTEIRLMDMDLLIVANLDAGEEVPYNWEDVKNVARAGTPTILIHPGKHFQWLYPGRVESIYERKGRVVAMEMPEHDAFSDIHPLELAWWQPENGERPRACRRSFRFKSMKEIQVLAGYIRPHVYLGDPVEQLKEMSGIPLLALPEDHIICSEMEVNRGTEDPVAAKLLINLLDAMFRLGEAYQ